MTKIIELIIKLLEKREANRKLVLDECVKPLQEQFDKIHAEYHEMFHRYRSELKSNGVTETFNEGISSDLNTILTTRIKLAGDMKNLRIVSSAKIDAFDNMVNDLIQGILVYLNMSGIDHWEESGVIGRRNPTFERISFLVGSSGNDNDITALRRFLDFVIDDLHNNYNDVTDNFSVMKSFLLTGNS